MIDKNVRNCNLVKRIVNIIQAFVAYVIAQTISDNFLNGSVVWTIVIMMVVLIAFIPLGIWLDKKIDARYEN